MKNIRIIKTGINVSKIKKQLEEHASDWNYQKELQHATVLDPDVYLSQSGVLQLVIGTIDKPGILTLGLITSTKTDITCQ